VIAELYDEYYTPNEIEYWTNWCLNKYQTAELLAPMTGTYNCHSYAWNMVEGGPLCWINDICQVRKYWLDGSYEETTKAYAEKIVWIEFEDATGNSYFETHTSVTSITHPNKQESKWGGLPLFRHLENEHPYTDISIFHYDPLDDGWIESKYYRRPCTNGFIQADTVNIGNKTVIYSGSVDILPGNTYIVTDTIRFACDASITVHPGGKLIVDGGVLTNACINGMWQGIVVKGTATTPQAAQTQGSVILIDATIENAVCAIDAASGNSTNGNGGIIQATNTKFINNVQSINYGSYENKNSSNALIDNIGFFTKCTFSINSNNYFSSNGHFFLNHVRLNKIRGIKFNGCTFNKQTNISVGIGIYAQDAGFTVGDYCTVSMQFDCACPTNNATRSYFDNFSYGIYTSNSGTPYAVSIDQCNFNNNTTGIYIYSNQYRVTRNIFTNIKDFGLISETSSGYRIEENSFNSNGTLGSTGICISNSGIAENRIYKNNFESLDYGIAAYLTNFYDDGLGTLLGLIYWGAGLQFLCNDFSFNNMDIAVDPMGTVRPTQGSILEGADNTFLYTIWSSLYFYNTQAFLYYHSGDIMGLISTSPNFPTTNVFIDGMAFPNPCWTTFCIPYYVNSSEEGQQNYQNLQNEYDNLIKQFDELGYGYVLDNMENGEFSEEMIMEALQFSGKISKVSNTMRELSDNSIRALMLDSIMDINLLKSWYEIVRTPIAKYLITETRLFTNDYEGADAILNQIPEMFQFTEREMIEHNNYLQFHNFKKQLQLEGRLWADLDEREISYLQTIAEANTGRSSTMAKGVLCFFFNICYEGTHLYPTSSEGGGETRNSDPKLNSGFNPVPVSEYGLTIYPNPANTEISVTIGISKVSIDKVELYDIFGQTLILQNFNKSQGVVPLRNISDGIYIMKVYLSNGEVENKKVVKK